MTGKADLTVRNRVREKLSRDELVVTMSIRLVRGIEIATILASGGFDVARIDLEHNSFSLETASQICLASLNVGITPIVRVPTLSPELVTRVLDGGALGIVAPHVQTAADARRAVECAKYPPFGHRSIATSLPHFGYKSYPQAQTQDAMNAATLVVALVESGEGIKNVDEIAAVEGVDIVSIGTGDLCTDLGIPGQLDHKLVDDAYVRTLAACRKHGKHCGMGSMGPREDLMAKYLKAGVRYLNLTNDLSLLLSAATESSRKARALLTDA